MSEDEYDALPDSKKAEVDRQRLMIKKERLKRLIFTGSSIVVHI